MFIDLFNFIAFDQGFPPKKYEKYYILPKRFLFAEHLV